MNKVEVFTKPLDEESQGKHFEVTFGTDLEVEWCIMLDGGGNPLYKVTFRAPSPERNSVYGFINGLIIDQEIKSVTDINTLVVIQGDRVAELSGDHIRNIITTCSCLSAEVVCTLRDLSDEDKAPFVPGV